MLVDVHAHAVPPEVVARLTRHGPRVGVEVVRRAGETWFDHRQGYRYPVGPAFTSVDTILSRMDRARLDHRILSIPPTLFFYDLPGGEAAELCSAINDALVAFANRGGGRLWAFITVPLQEPLAAAREVERSASHPVVKGVEIGTDAGGRALDDQALAPFFQACEQAGLPVFLHPYYLGPKPGLEPYYLTNSIGNPLETTIAIARLIHGGVLERHPQLRVVLAHGGGFFPYQLGRLEHAFAVRPEPSATCDRPPSAYHDRIYYDSVLHLPAALRYLVEVAGADHVLMGSDDPFDMGTEDPAALVEAARLEPDAREAVLGQSAIRLLGLTPAGRVADGRGRAGETG
ncbi:amidohydrolase family protein [Geochorda subterranea]|uniref:Amidohydrolase family protein n=1 Tax=Geochorda subterranea TaxID=3109564 RepID=A0ABZ1BQD9_9FIRM|nr:amidohydrolase family protein [Limnochorda sp. LNt]WRP15025.1 amidohydrolase family protein [Limnochorda sp. LNt]